MSKAKLIPLGDINQRQNSEDCQKKSKESDAANNIPNRQVFLDFHKALLIRIVRR